MLWGKRRKRQNLHACFNLVVFIVRSTSSLQILHGLDLSTRVAIVTGANTGIGFETARSLALHGCQVILACRDLSKAEQAVGKIRSERGHARCSPLHLDLSSLSSVRTFAAQFLKHQSSLDMLVLNAGVFGLGFSQTEDGLETMFQVRHSIQVVLNKTNKFSFINAAVLFKCGLSFQFNKCARSYKNKIQVTASPKSNNIMATYWMTGF